MIVDDTPDIGRRLRALEGRPDPSTDPAARDARTLCERIEELRSAHPSLRGCDGHRAAQEILSNPPYAIPNEAFHALEQQRLRDAARPLRPWDGRPMEPGRMLPERMLSTPGIPARPLADVLGIEPAEPEIKPALLPDGQIDIRIDVTALARDVRSRNDLAAAIRRECELQIRELWLR